MYCLSCEDIAKSSSLRWASTPYLPESHRQDQHLNSFSSSYYGQHPLVTNCGHQLQLYCPQCDASGELSSGRWASAPSLPKSYGQEQHLHNSSPSSDNRQQPLVTNFGQVSSSSSSSSSHGHSKFPQGTPPLLITIFQMGDKERNGFIDENGLQDALSPDYQRFSLRTVRLLMSVFKNAKDSLGIGPIEFVALYSCLRQCKTIFAKFDRDRNGKIDAMELIDALNSFGYRIPPLVAQFLISKYDNGWEELNFDSFVQCGMIVKGLTEKFKGKDLRYTGSATIEYNTFMIMIMPFLML